jgi:hypothetical protein
MYDHNTLNIDKLTDDSNNLIDLRYNANNATKILRQEDAGYSDVESEPDC